MKQWLTILLLVVNFAAFSQDRLILKNQTEYQVNIISILQNDILFKAWQSIDTTTYSINKSEVSAIVYRNGQRVSITVESAIPQSATPNYQQPSVGSPQGNYVPMPNYNQAQTTEQITTNEDFEHTFVTRDKTLPKATRSNRKEIIQQMRSDEILKERYTGDATMHLGLNVMSIGQSTIPSIVFYTDRVIAKNFAITVGGGISYDNLTLYEYKYHFLSEYFILGGVYYFNQLLKIRKEKASLYAGVALFPSLTFQFDNVPYDYTSSYDSGVNFGFNGGLRIGGGYNISKKIGLFSDIFIGKGRPAINLGIRFNRLRFH